LGSLVVVDTLIVGAYFGVDRIVSRFQEGLGEGVQQGVSTIVGGRAEIATATLQMVRDFPLAGIGAGTFRFVFPQYRPPDLPAFATNVENDYLEFLVELGVIGCIPLVLIALLPVVRGVRLVRRTESQFVRGMTLGSLLTVIALSLHAFADFNLRIPSNAALLVISLALICAASALDEAGVDEGRMANGDA
jgi:O-antigen ligase